MTANDIFRICADVELPLLSGADLLKMEHGTDLVKMELVRKSGIPAEASCPLCYGEHFGRTGLFHPESGKYSFRCPHCGHMLINTRDLENWKLDYDALVRLTAKKNRMQRGPRRSPGTSVESRLLLDRIQQTGVDRPKILLGKEE